MRRRSAFRGPRKPAAAVKGTATELAVLELLQKYRFLPSTYIRAHFAATQYIEDVLPNLVEAHLIGIPSKAQDRCKTRAVPYVYELRPLGEVMLAKRGKWSEGQRGGKGGGWFEHDFLCSIVQYSFDQAPAAVPGLSLRTPHSILDHPNCPEATRRSLTPFVIPTAPKLTADAEPFGFEYQGSKIFFHGFEADCSTESLNTIKSKLERYSQYLDHHLPTKMYGFLKNHMHILIVTTSERRARNMATLVPDHLADRFHFKAIPGFHDKFPPPTAHLFLEPWIQKGGGEWSILNHLKGERRDPRNQDRTSEGIGSPAREDRPGA
jgi:hypothetical protein